MSLCICMYPYACIHVSARVHIINIVEKNVVKVSPKA